MFLCGINGFANTKLLTYSYLIPLCTASTCLSKSFFLPKVAEQPGTRHGISPSAGAEEDWVSNEDEMGADEADEDGGADEEDDVDAGAVLGGGEGCLGGRS